jgi:cytochrome c oxidase subunit 3
MPNERSVTEAAVVIEPAFSYRAPRWWGSRIVMFVEGVAFATLAFTYFYIRRSAGVWPPPPTPLPDLRLPSLTLLVLSIGAAPYWYAARLARLNARPRVVAAWLVLGVMFGISAVVLRGYDFGALHTRFNSSQYGAITWAILLVHLAHLLAAVLESSLVAAMLLSAPEQRERYADVSAMAMYWYLVAGSWVALYGIVFISPRFRVV